MAAVAHKAFRARSTRDFVERLSPGGVFVDVKGIADCAGLEALGVKTWRL